ncbi:MAG: hypothetical protein ACJ735_12935 [Actinomycetes bacterium]
MTSPTQDVWQEWRNWLSRSTEQQVRAWRNYADTTSKLLRSQASPLDAGRAYLRVARDESSHYVRELSRLGVRYASGVSELNRHLADRLTSALATEARHEHPRRITLPMHGVLGSTAKATFTVANPQSTRAAVRFTPSAMRATGAAAFHPALSFTPSTLDLAPGEEATVTIALPLTDGLFAVGGHYEATIDVIGSDPLQIDLRVSVDPKKG